MLVIDDDEESRRTLRVALKWARFPVEISLRFADDCEAALDGIIEGTAPLPTMVLINLDRKGKQCLKVLQRLKQNESTCIIPVAAWTRKTGNEALDQAYAASANCVLCRPETVEEAELMLTRLVAFWSLPNVILPVRRAQ